MQLDEIERQKGVMTVNADDIMNCTMTMGHRARANFRLAACSAADADTRLKPSPIPACRVETYPYHVQHAKNNLKNSVHLSNLIIHRETHSFDGRNILLENRGSPTDNSSPVPVAQCFKKLFPTQKHCIDVRIHVKIFMGICWNISHFAVRGEYRWRFLESLSESNPAWTC